MDVVHSKSVPQQPETTGHGAKKRSCRRNSMGDTCSKSQTKYKQVPCRSDILETMTSMHKFKSVRALSQHRHYQIISLYGLPWLGHRTERQPCSLFYGCQRGWLYSNPAASEQGDTLRNWFNTIQLHGSRDLRILQPHRLVAVDQVSRWWTTDAAVTALALTVIGLVDSWCVCHFEPYQGLRTWS